jgi:hypothetical protein
MAVKRTVQVTVKHRIMGCVVAKEQLPDAAKSAVNNTRTHPTAGTTCVTMRKIRACI